MNAKKISDVDFVKGFKNWRDISDNLCISAKEHFRLKRAYFAKLFYETPNTSLCGVAASPDSAKNPAVEATGKPETSTAATSAPSIVRQKNLNSRIKNV